MYQRHQARSQTSSNRQKRSQPEPPTPIKPPPQLLARDRLNVVGENHPESDLRRDEEQQFVAEQTGIEKGKGYLTEEQLTQIHIYFLL